jgi:hypothetical protein
VIEVLNPRLDDKAVIDRWRMHFLDDFNFDRQGLRDQELRRFLRTSSMCAGSVFIQQKRHEHQLFSLPLLRESFPL